MISVKTEFIVENLLDAFHLAYYIPRNRPDDTPITGYIVEFKANTAKYVDAWSNWACKELKEANLNVDCIVRALGSKELYAEDTKPLDELGRRLASTLNTKYLPRLLAKSRIIPQMHKTRTMIEKSIAIKDSYFVTDINLDFNNRNILIIDDISTSKVTIFEILRALRSKYESARYYFFFLAKTRYNRDSNKNIDLRIFK